MSRHYWRSLEERAQTDELSSWLGEHAPSHAFELGGAVDRRRFLQLMAASIGLAGLSGCRRPELKVLPYVKSPEDVIDGLPSFYATSLPRPGGGFPILVESHEGRPTKIEGNPLWTSSGGAADSQAQAAILSLYDPDRGSGVSQKGETSSWEEFDAFAESHFGPIRSARGKGLAILTEEVNSPSFDLLLAHFRATMPEAKVYSYEPFSRDNERDGLDTAFGASVCPSYKLDQAKVILALDSDFLATEDEGVVNAIGFANGRRVSSRDDARKMNRLYAVESVYSLTGGMADHRLRIASGHILAYLSDLARQILPAANPPLPDRGMKSAFADGTTRPAIDGLWIDEVAADLKTHRGSALVIVGRRQPQAVHALAALINEALGAIGKTVEYLPENRPASEGIERLAEAIRKDEVSTLVLIGGNPAYDAPAPLNFAKLILSVPTTLRIGLHFDETSAQCGWHLPMAHPLESWGDLRLADGTMAAIQPLIEPLFLGRSAIELLARMAKFETTNGYEIVRRAFRKDFGDSEDDWKRFLHTGLTTKKPTAPLSVTPRREAIVAALKATPESAAKLDDEALELVFLRDAKIDDGRFSNNGWLQEVPDPITKLTWDNAALLSPKLAKRLGINDGDVIRLTLENTSIEIAALVAPGQAEHTVAVAVGYGRTHAGNVGNGVGVNVYPLRRDRRGGFTSGLKIARVGRTYDLARTQSHHSMEGRDLVREIDTSLYQIGEIGHHNHERLPDLQTRPAFEGEHQWGMAIDLTTCLGCNACTVACQAENNIPIVGKGEVLRGREMHWIRQDRYFSGSEDDPGMVTQPVACVQCESAPCEAVCPVNASVHNEEGLNLQVYNRCVGTRYCSNNCPYKVRRFNWFNYNERPLDRLREGPLAPKGMAETLQMGKNPDVTVRIRGVMEKCTYCIQRIERGKIGARVAAGDSNAHKVPDGTITPACAQTCPTKAIVFGDISDPESRVSKIKAQDRDYALLGELNTKPRTTYQARLRNPNPKMTPSGAKTGASHA